MKDFLLLANVNAVTYKEFFPLLKEGKARSGYNFNKTLMFETPEGEKSGPNIAWLTTLPTPDKKKLILTKTYNEKDYPRYDNYDAIEVGRIKDIPYDYDCVMGVPITIFGYDLDNVEIVDLSRYLQASSGMSKEFVDEYYRQGNTGQICEGHPDLCFYDKGKAVVPYMRVLIKKKIVIMDEEVIHNNDTKINGKEQYRRVCIRLIRRKQP